MKVFNQNRGEVSQILDHRMMNMALNGREIKVMHLQIEWSNTEDPSDMFTWEPLARVNRDVPQMVFEYCQGAGLSLDGILKDESIRRGNQTFSGRKVWSKDKDKA